MLKTLPKNLLFAMVLFSWQMLSAQNLVPNPSFENFSICPDNFDQLSRCNAWVSPTTGSSDYFNACDFTNTVGVPTNLMGMQSANTGNGYVGIITKHPTAEYREYIQAQLISPLAAGQQYEVSFYTSSGEQAIWWTDLIQVHFSNGAIGSAGNLVLPQAPQLSTPTGPVISEETNWVQYTFTYTATGGEDHITIGNFTNDAGTTFSSGSAPFSAIHSYYYIDDVSVIPRSLPVNFLAFTVRIAKMNKVVLNWTLATDKEIEHIAVQRSSNGIVFSDIHILDTDMGTSLQDYQYSDRHPLKGLNYYRLKVTDKKGGEIYSRIRSVNVKENLIVSSPYPNPAHDFTTIDINSIEPTTVSLKLINILGKEVLSNTYQIEDSSLIKINTSELASGTYTVLVQSYSPHKRVVSNIVVP